MVVALIDGDILTYRIGHTTNQDSVGIARVRCDDLVDSILTETKATEFEVWLSDGHEGNFRYQVWPHYKANRVAPRPVHYEALKEHLIVAWGARIAYGMEADDALGIGQRAYFSDNPEFGGSPRDCVICSIDKDLHQIPGQHYNFVRKEWKDVTIWEGLQWFYKQILIGDNSDNIRGCRGVGPVKASKAIDQIPQDEGESALFEKVVKLYEKQEVEATHQEILDHILLVGRLLKIKQTEDEPLWHFPKSSLTAADQSSSTQPKPEGCIPSTEPFMTESAGFPPRGVLLADSELETTPQHSI